MLIVEDSERLRRSLALGLRKSGMVVDLAADGPAGLEFAIASDHDAIVLDLMLPGLPGLELLARLRERDQETPVLILSARDQVADRVRGLESGADDYLVKPFAFDELVARLHALRRRRHDRRSPLVRVGELELDFVRRQVRVGGEPVQLTAGEHRVLETLVLRRGRVVSKRELVELLHDANESVTENAIEVLVSALRRKIRRPDGEIVRTRRGFGYVVE